MKITLTILNNEVLPKDELGDVQHATWHSRDKTYISNQMDNDIINSPYNNKIERIIIDDTQLTSKKQVDDLMIFLYNAKDSLQY